MGKSMNNLYKKFHSLAIFVWTIAFMGFVVHAQTLVSMGTLSYMKINSDLSKTFITTSTDATLEIRTEATECATVSRNSLLLAIASNEGIIVKNLITGQVISSSNIVITESTCNIGWNQNDHLNIMLPTSPGSVLEWDVTTDTFNSIQIRSVPMELPMMLQGAPYVMSSNGQFVVYEQCLSGIGQSDTQYCDGEANIVLFDTFIQQVVRTISDLSVGQLGIGSAELEFYFNRGLLARARNTEVYFSPSGTYLFYFTSQGTREFVLYNIQSDTSTIVPVPSDKLVNTLVSFPKWSPDETVVGYWPSDPFLSTPGVPQQFAFYNIKTGESRLTSRELILRTADRWEWSPNNTEIALITSDNTLKIFNVLSEQEFILDTNVYSIIGWIP
jgi:WD40 repeat protein